MRIKRSLSLFLLLIVVRLALRAQFISLPKGNYDISISGYGSTSSSRIPFWLYANQYGIIPKTTPLFIPRVAFSNLKSDTANTDWSQLRLIYSLDLPVVISTSAAKPHLVEAHAAVRYGPFELYLGRRREITGLLGDTLLSSGSYAWSGNSLPITKVQFSIPNYISFPFTKGLISFKGTFAHGWLYTLAVAYGGRGVKAVEGYLHQKTFYLKIGKPNWKINVTAGFNHQAQWGGEDQIWPNGLPPKEAWWAVVFGKPWEDSRVGNHLGTIDLGLNWQLEAGKSLFFYRQNIFDDGSLYKFLNIQDGLQGVVFTNRLSQDFTHTITLKKVVVEWLNTTNQGGAVFDFQQQIFGRDNYFNHYVYSQGWSYKGQIIGTPFIPAQTDVKSSLTPIKNMITNNNRVQMIHLAANGWLDDWQWLFKTSFSINYGLYDYPYPRRQNQLSSLIQFHKELRWLGGIDWSTSLAFDVGTLYDPSMGIQIGLRKRRFF
jgi:hypothetical protein